MQIVDNGGRRSESDRRQNTLPIGFPDPRSDFDRRCMRDRRNGKDRRTGLDRRNPNGMRAKAKVDRRAKLPSACFYCGNICDTNQDWIQKVRTVEKIADLPTSICMECWKKNFPKFII